MMNDARGAMASDQDGDGNVLAFLALTTALSTPFWALGGASGRELLPGLPLSALMTVCPLAAAAILTQRRAGRAGVTALLGRALDARRIPSPTWYLPALLLNPGVAALVYGWQRARGVPVSPFEATLVAASGLALLFLVAAVGEEVGWSGYAFDPLVRPWGPLGAGLGLGALWAAWHLIPYAQAGRSGEWIAWQCVKTVASRMLIGWLYTRTGGSVFATVLFHASDNLSVFLFPQAGSHYDPRATAIILGGVAALASWWPNAQRGTWTS
jgi:membrane protease YdiL (CAAX protease family)